VTGLRSLRRWLPPALTGLAVAMLCAFLWWNREYVSASYSLRPGAFLAVAGLSALSLGVRGLANRLHFGPLGVAASIGDWVRLVTVTALANYLPFSAGLVAKAVFLNRVHELPYGRFAVGQTSLLLLIIMTNGAVGLVILGLGFPDRLFGVVGAGFLAMLTAGLPLWLPEPWQQRLSTRWLPLTAIARPTRRHWPWVALCQLGLLLLASAGLQLCFSMGGSQVGLLACVLFTAAAVLARLVTIVPGALGVREFLVGGLALLTGFDMRDAVVASTIARAAEIAVVFSLGGVFSWSLSGQLAANGPSDPISDTPEAPE
jgi:uncharacterized membrane protein YbhN (UPF0104 family)